MAGGFVEIQKIRIEEIVKFYLARKILHNKT